jgi:hypothetical protein
MINWFYKWLGDKISAVNSPPDMDTESSGVNLIGRPISKSRRIASVRESDDLSTEPITFKMFKASGGWAIEFRQYDTRNDKVDTSLYVVNDEEELGRHISQIITMEALKR